MERLVEGKGSCTTTAPGRIRSLQSTGLSPTTEQVQVAQFLDISPLLQERAKLPKLIHVPGPPQATAHMQLCLSYRRHSGEQTLACARRAGWTTHHAIVRGHIASHWGVPLSSLSNQRRLLILCCVVKWRSLPLTMSCPGWLVMGGAWVYALLVPVESSSSSDEAPDQRPQNQGVARALPGTGPSSPRPSPTRSPVCTLNVFQGAQAEVPGDRASPVWERSLLINGKVAFS